MHLRPIALESSLTTCVDAIAMCLGNALLANCSWANLEAVVQSLPAS